MFICFIFFILEKDELDIASNCLMKYFFAEGMACKHSIFAASNDVDPKSLVSKFE
jgi:hypothetical protein